MNKLTSKEIKKLQELKSIDKLLKIIEILRDPIKGCPWDLKQDYMSLRNYSIEEAYELQNAIEKRDIKNIKEELGDLLLQIVLLSQIADEKNDFNFEDVASDVAEKMIRRHPQIFDKNYKNLDKPQDTWEKIKLEEKISKTEKDFHSIFEDIPSNLSPFLRSYKIQKKVSTKYFFDWKHYKDVMKKIDEELDELKHALKNINQIDNIEEEIGDLIFTIINLIRHLKLNPDIVMRRSIKKFENRFLYIEKKIYNEKIKITKKNKMILEKLWKESKKIMRENNE